jgi:hypothetical protein
MNDNRSWRIAIGSEWYPLDDTATEYVSYLFYRNMSGYILSSFFRHSPVYFELDDDMALFHEGKKYPIAYC